MKIDVQIPMLWGEPKVIQVSAEVETRFRLRAALVEAVAKGSNLDGANLTRANLTRTNLDGANLDGANLTGANLDGANLYGANLTRANLTRANLDGANLYGANLDGADLYGANLYGANLDGANLYGANLDGANLYGANLDGANLDGATLLAAGEMKRLRTMQIDRWRIGYTSDTLQIGCQRHPIEKWRKWNTPAGRKWIDSMDSMDSHALSWADRNLALVLALIDANPAD